MPNAKTRHLLLAVYLLAPAARAAAPAALPGDIRYPPLPEFRIPKPERLVLGNGMVVLLLPDRDLPLVQATALIKTGARLEPADKVGLASLAGNVLRTGGTARRSGDDIDDLLEGLGATVETGIRADQGRAFLSCLASDLDATLGVLAEILREPAFAQDKLDVAKSQAKSGISRRNDDVGGILSREFAKLVYGKDAVYARHAEYATLDAITRDDLVAFHRAHFHPNRTLLGVTGDFDPKALRKLLEKHFGSWPRGPEGAKFVGGYSASPRPGVFYIEKNDVNQSNIALGHLGITTDSPDYYAVSVLNEVFGGGFSARLFTNVRSKKGLAYAVGGRVGDDYDHPALLRITLLTKSETTVQGVRALHEEIESIRKAPPSDAELKKAKDSILNSFIFNFDTKGEILERQLSYEYFGYPLDFLDRYRAGIEKVTAAEVQAAAVRYIRPEELTLLVVGKGKDFDKPLLELGKVETLDVAIPEPKKDTPKATAESLEKGKAAVDRAVAAMGGHAALAAIRAVESKGSAVMTTPMGPVNAKLRVVWQAPDRMRQEMETPMGSMLSVIAGEKGYAATPMGVQELPEARRADALKQARRAPWQLLASPGLVAQHLGSEELAGVRADRVRVAAGEVDCTLWIDAAGTVLRDSYTASGPSGAPAETVRSYSDWRPVAGVRFAHKVEATMDGKPFQTLTYESIAVNPTLDAKDFARPEAAAAPAPGR